MAATDLKIRISADSAGAKAAFDSVKRNMADLDRQAKSVRDGLSGLGTSLKGFAAGFVGLEGVKSALTTFIRVNAETDKLRANLVTATGSVEAAGKAWDDLAKFAATTPYAVNEVVDAFIKLRNYGLNPTKETMIAYGNIASSMGKTLMQWADAVGDAVTGQFDRLPEFGIKASKEGERITFVFRGVATEVGNNAAEIEQYLRRLGEVEFAGSMERQTKTLGASVDRLVEAWDNGWRRMGDTGLTAGAISLIDQLSDKIDEASGVWADRFKKISNASQGLGYQLFGQPTEELKALNEAIAVAKAESDKALAELKRANEVVATASAKGKSGKVASFFFEDAVQADKELFALEERRAALIKQIAAEAAADYESRLAREQELQNARDLVGKGWTEAPPVIEFKIDPKLDKVDPELATNITLLLERAAAEGIKLGITSGFRDPKAAENWQRYYDAIKKYGSVAEARKYVAPPDISMHGKGIAVDVQIRGVLNEDDIKAKMQRVGELAKELNLIAPVATENWGNPKDGMVHIQLAEDKERESKTTRGLGAAQKEYNAALAEGARIYEQTRTPVEALAIRLKELEGLYAAGAIQDQETYYRAVAQAQADFAEGVARLQGDLEKTQTPAQALEQAIVMLNAAYQSGALGIDAYVQAVTRAQEAFAQSSQKLQNATQELPSLTDRLNDAGKEMGQSFAQAFENAVLGAGKLQDILQALLRDMASAILRKTVTDPLAKASGDFFSKYLAEIFKFSAGGIMTANGPLALPRFAMGGVMSAGGPLPLKRYASGGVANSPQLALFGEGSMNEAYVPLPDGRSIPVSFKDTPDTASKPLEITVKNLAGQSANVSQDQQGGLTIEIVRAQLANDMQRGGVPWVNSLERRYGMTRGRG